MQPLGRTIVRWRHQIAASRQARHANGPTEAANNMIKRIKQVAFGITNWTDYRTRTRLHGQCLSGGYAGRRHRRNSMIWRAIIDDEAHHPAAIAWRQ